MSLVRPEHFEIDYSHWLARDLVIGALGSNPHGGYAHDSGPSRNHGTFISNALNEVAPYGTIYGRNSWFLPGDAAASTQSYIDFGTNSSLQVDGDMTAAIWVQVRTNLSCFIFNTFQSGSGTSFNMHYDPTGELNAFWDDGTDTVAPNKTVAAWYNTWRHVAIRLSGTTGTLWVDGKQEATASNASLGSYASDENVLVGRRSDTVSEALRNGRVADIMLYNRALADAEIRRLADPGDPMLSGLVLAPRRVQVQVPSAASYTIVCAQGSYAQNGQAVALEADRTLTATQGGYNVNGQAVTLTTGYILTAAQGSYTLTGQDVTLTYTPAGAYQITCDQGSYALNGQAVGLEVDRTLVLAQGSYAVNGQAVALERGFTLTCEQGSYTYTGQTLSLIVARALAAAQGSYAVNGQTVTLSYSGTVAAVPDLHYRIDDPMPHYRINDPMPHYRIED